MSKRHSCVNLLVLIRKFPPALIALLLQFAALAFAVLGVWLVGQPLSLVAFSFLCGLFASVFSYFAGLARWWLAIQLLFAPSLVWVHAFDISPGYFLFAFFMFLIVYWSTFRTQVPLYLSSKRVWYALENFLPAKENFRFIDLGSGLGGVLTHLADVRPDGQYSGVESAPLPFLWSWLRIKLGRFHNCTVHWGSIWNQNLKACHLAQYDIVFAYLSPVPMEKLWRKARAEMCPGSVFISSTFAVPEQLPHETVQVDDLHRSVLLIWRM